jgi:Asp-tRNA(Asn)/Glu-tRNA(Gln) amidotransferase A subunit family amidase
MADLLHRPLTEVCRSLARRELSAVELMQATLTRIDAFNPTLNAFVAFREREQLLADAQAADARIARGEARALEGIPLGVKDLEDVAGLVTSEGSVPFKDNLAERDSVQVARLRAAGAIVVGKTNAPEFGYTAITKNLLFGVTRNPWDLERTPGGSSSGSAAAVASGMVPAALGTQVIGSTIRPASYCGTYGYKPSVNALNREGCHDYQSQSCTGIIAATAAGSTVEISANPFTNTGTIQELNGGKIVTVP